VYLEVSQGELLSVLGHNGAGKSTLINIITGLLSASSGEVYVKGMNIVEECSSVFLAYWYLSLI